MVHSDGIWNDLALQRKKNKNKDAKGCILTVFETIWNYREMFLKTRTLDGAFWRYLKQFGTAEKNLKTKTVKGAFWRHLNQFGTAENFLKTRTLNGASFETIWNCRHNFENKDAKWCILTASDTIWNFREKNENKDA